MHSQSIQVLYDEHDVILKAIEQVETLLQSDNLITHQESLFWFISFFRQYGDAYHHLKEEEILFSLLGKKNEMLAENILTALGDHHNMFREYLQEIESAISEKNWETMHRIFKKYLSDLTDHINAENNDLFITAEDILDEQEKENLYFSFLDKDRELGEDKKQEFENRIMAGS